MINTISRALPRFFLGALWGLGGEALPVGLAGAGLVPGAAGGRVPAGRWGLAFALGAVCGRGAGCRGALPGCGGVAGRGTGREAWSAAETGRGGAIEAPQSWQNFAFSGNWAPQALQNIRIAPFIISFILQ